MFKSVFYCRILHISCLLFDPLILMFAHSANYLVAIVKGSKQETTERCIIKGQPRSMGELPYRLVDQCATWSDVSDWSADCQEKMKGY